MVTPAVGVALTAIALPIVKAPARDDCRRSKAAPKVMVPVPSGPLDRVPEVVMLEASATSVPLAIDVPPV